MINILQIALSLQNISIKHINIKINVYFWQPGFKKGDNWNANRTHPFIFSWLAIIGPKLFFTRSWSAIIGTKQLRVNQSPQQWRGRYTCTRICRFLVVGNIFWLETWMNILVKVLSYSKLNFQGKVFFTQNWCNIILSCINEYLLYSITCTSVSTTFIENSRR